MKHTFVKMLAWLAICVALWFGGLSWFIEQVPLTANTSPDKADAIVVLTGGGGRIEYGLQLLAEGKADNLLITGIHDTMRVEDVILRHSPEKYHDTLLKLADHITLGHIAENTIGNAEETRIWLKDRNIQTIRLVTSNYHMPRSLEEFHHAMPSVTFIPCPVLPEDFAMVNWWQKPIGRGIILSEYFKILASYTRHGLITFIHRHP